MSNGKNVSPIDKQEPKSVIEISSTLQVLLNRLVESVASVSELVQDIKTQAEAEGLTFEQTRELIVAALKKRKLSDRSIRVYLPSELKNQRARENGIKGNQSEKRTIAAVTAANTEAPVLSPTQTSANPELEEKERTIALLANQLAEKTAEIAVQKADIEALKQEKKTLEEQLSQTIVQPASEYAEDPTVLKKRIVDQAKLLLPFECKVNFEIRGQILPLIVKVQPVSKTASVILDEAEARRISLA